MDLPVGHMAKYEGIRATTVLRIAAATILLVGVVGAVLVPDGLSCGPDARLIEGTVNGRPAQSCEEPGELRALEPRRDARIPVRVAVAAVAGVVAIAPWLTARRRHRESSGTGAESSRSVP